MLTATFTQLRQMARDYPGTIATIRRFENMDLPPCPRCNSTHTALIQSGIIGRTILLKTATTRFFLMPNRPNNHKHWCHQCKENF